LARRVTELQPQKHDSERVNVYLDGVFAFGASAMVVMAKGLRVGDDLSDEQVDALQHDETVERAHASALNVLSYRPRSGREIALHLQKKAVPPEVIEAVIQRLQRSGLVNDQEFARFWVENRQKFRPRGERVLRMEMNQKGLARDVVDQALESLPDEENTAYTLALTKIRTFQQYDDRNFANKLIGFLQRRGFRYEVASAVARRIVTERTENAGLE